MLPRTHLQPQRSHSCPLLLLLGKLDILEPNVWLMRHLFHVFPRCTSFRRTHSLHLAQALSFSFQNILKIDNLNGLYALVKLQLDNNIIEKIENIEHLTNLEWLDLSFNNISKIEGLDSLLKLTDISLFNNRIEKLKGLDNLTDLNCLSIGNNQITDLLSCLQYLRSFGNLRILSMQGNPCARDPDYHTRVIAHLAQRSDQAKSLHLSGIHARRASPTRDNPTDIGTPQMWFTSTTSW